MKKLDGSFEYLELSVPKVFKDSNWKLPNQVGSWECSLSRFDKKNYTYSRMSLHCISKENENIHLTSMIDCNNRNRKNNELGVLYPKTIKDDKSVPFPNTVIYLKCEL